MKRIRDFLLVVVTLLIILYAQAVISPHTAQKTKPKPTEQLPVKEKEKEAASLQGKLPAKGLSRWVGKKAASFTQTFGPPKEKHQLNEKEAWWLFGEGSSDFFEIFVQDDTITSILVLGPLVEADTFHVGMNLQELTNITTFYPDVTFSYQKEKYIIELSEEDLNYQPMITFDNNSFALLPINRETGQLLGIRYVSPGMLLALQPYLIQSEDRVSLDKKIPKPLPQKDDAKKQQMLRLLNVMRDNEELAKLKLNPQLDEEATTYLSMFLTNQTEILEESRLEELEKTKQHANYDTSFYLEKAETKRLSDVVSQSITQDVDQTKEQETKDQIEGASLLYAPIKDIPMFVMEWYAELTYLAPINSENMTQMGVSFKEPFTMVLLNE